MNLKKLSAICVLSLAGIVSANAATITADAARQAANDFLKKNVATKGMFHAPSMADLKLAHAEASSVEGNAYYVFNIQGGGWVIMAGDDRAKQVLAYGNTGNIDMNNLPGNMKAYLNMLKGQIETAQAYKGKTVPVKSSKRSTPIDPMLKSSWGQGDPWNRLCPTNALGQRTSVGCAPLAMAQIMNYWKYPSEVSAVPGYSGNYTSLPATTFNYDLILDQYAYYDPVTGNPIVVDFTEDQANEVAKLSRYCGQACKSRYGNSGTSTGSYSYDQRDGFKTFGFNENLQLIGKDSFYYTDNSNNYTIDEWCELICSELEAGRPIPYHDVWEGHAWVLDGVDAEGKFHMNWGFNGKFDGWYEIDALSFHPYGDDEIWDFSQTSNSGNQMVIGCYPYEGYVIPGAKTPKPVINYHITANNVVFEATGDGEIHLYIDGVEYQSPCTYALGSSEQTVVVTATAKMEGLSTSDNAEMSYLLPAKPFKLGDVNKDGYVKISDVTALIDILLVGSNSTVIDLRNEVNGYGGVTIADVTALIDILLSGNE